MQEVTVILRQDDAGWLLDMLWDEYPDDEELVEEYPEPLERVGRIRQALKAGGRP